MPNPCAQGLPLLPRTSRRQSLMTAVSWLTLCVGFAVPHTPVMAQTVTYNYTGSIVNTTITTGGTYRITVAGASGGRGVNDVGGAGARVVGNIDIPAGVALQLIVGGKGGDGYALPGGWAGGGGGGSFVVVPDVQFPLIVAGGGGGAGYSSSDGGAGLTTSNGDAGAGARDLGSFSCGQGGGEGGGGEGGCGEGGQGGGGGGFSSDGGNTFGARGGTALLGGFAGGDGENNGQPQGGFGGGGGGGLYGGGGGGGVSGGGGGGDSDGGAGGGGGSYVYFEFSSIIMQSGFNIGDGYIIFDLISAFASDIPIITTTNIENTSGNYISDIGNTLYPVFDGGTLSINIDGSDTTHYTITHNGGAIDAAGHSLTFAGAIADDEFQTRTGQTPGSLTFTNSGLGGAITLSGTNTYAGGTTLKSGTYVIAGNNSAFGSGVITMNPFSTIGFAPGQDVTLANNIVTSGDPTFVTAAGQVDTLSGILSDGAQPGLVEVQGSGRLVVTGENTYSGGTTIASGAALQVGAGATTGAIIGPVVNNGALIFNRSDAQAFAGPMSGAGALTKAGAGTLNLTGTNTYSGGTTVAAGTLTGDTTSLQGAIANNSSVQFAQVTSGTYAGAMRGTGTLTKAGAGTLNLTGTNTYSGGTTVAAGTLTGDTTSLQGAIANNSSVQFARVTSGTYAGAMSGIGSLTKTGAGTLTLTGTNTFSGGTTVAAGTLSGNATSLQGTILNNSSVAFAQVTDGTYAGAMSGTGALTKSGAGTLTLTGTSAISGQTTVQAGKLAVQGVLGASGLTVASGATLSGSGTVAGNVAIASGATLAPGNSPGTLTVAGNVTQAAGSTYAVDIDGRTWSAAGGAGSYDRLSVTGATGVFTAGGVIAPTLRGITGSATNNFTPVLGDTFTVVTAGSVAGSFSGVTQPASGLAANQRLDVLYGAKTLNLVVTPASYGLLAQSSGWIGNAAAPAAALDAIRPAAGSAGTPAQALFSGLYGLNADQLPAAFQQLGGEVYADEVLSDRLALRSSLKTVLNNVGHDDQPGDLARSQATSCSPKTGWIEIVGDRERVTGDTNALGFRNGRYGFVAGVSPVNTCSSQLGVAVSYRKGELTSDALSSAKDTGASISIYGARQSGKWSVRAALAGSISDWAMVRNTKALVGGSTTSQASENLRALGVSLESRYQLITGRNYRISGIAGVQAERVKAGGAQETGGGINNLTLGSGQWSSGQTRLGLEGRMQHDRVAASLAASWTHEIGANGRTLRPVALGGANWDTGSVDVGRDGIAFEAGMAFRPTAATQIKLGYSGHAQRRIFSNKASITAVMAW